MPIASQQPTALLAPSIPPIDLQTTSLRPAWQGEALANKTFLVHYEQGPFMQNLSSSITPKKLRVKRKHKQAASKVGVSG